MRLTALFIFLLSVHVFAKGVSQEISFTGKDVTLEKAFAEIKAQTGYLVVGNKALLKEASRVSVSVQKMPLKGFLDLLLKHQPLKYVIEEQTIIISAKRDMPDAAAQSYVAAVYAAPPPPVQVTGYLYRQDGKDVLSGATIQVKDAKSSVSSGTDGKFTIKANIGDVLVISFVGFETRTVTVQGANLGVIYLAASQNQLDETVVMAYGTTTRRFNTGNISRVSSEDIAKQPVSNPLLALPGRMPGVMVTQGSATQKDGGKNGGIFPRYQTCSERHPPNQF